MAGKSSNLGASSSACTKKAKQLEAKKRKQCATRAEGAKKPCPFQLIDFTAHRRSSGTAVPAAVPLHRGASNTGTAFPFPMPGVNGAAPLWSTAATLGAASRAAALTSSSLPATAEASRGPATAPVVIAPAPGLQPPASAAASNSAAALALPAASSAATGVRPPLVLAPAGAAGELVPLPLQFVGYHPACRASNLLPAPAVGIPLAAALNKIENGALGRMLSSLMPACHPPLMQHDSKRGPPPPWWPTGSEDWWATELLDHLDTVAALMLHAPAAAPLVPFKPCYSLKKAQRVALLVAIVKHLAPDFACAAAAVSHSGKLSVSETNLWHSALNNERAKWTRPAFVLLPQPQPQQQQQGGGAGGGSGPSVAGSVVVHSGNAAGASVGCELQVANLPAGASESVPADGSRGRGEVIAVAEPVEKEQRSDTYGVGVGVGVVSAATDAPAAGGGRDQPVNNFPAGGDGSTHMQGAAVATPPTGHVRQVAAGGPEMTMQPQPEQHGGVPGNGVAAAEDDQVEAHPVFDVEGHQWWPKNEELYRMFADFESFGDVWC